MKSMRVLQRILFTFAMVVGLTLSVSAQKDPKKPTPPKQDPPVVTPQPKNPPKENPPDKPKKPAFAVVASVPRPDGESD